MVTRMSPATRGSRRVDPSDPIGQYVITSPDPVASVSDDNLQIALQALNQAAGDATREVDGRCWTPGLSVVVVRHVGDAPRARRRATETRCRGHKDPWAVSVGYSVVDEFDRARMLNTTLRQWLSHRSGLPDTPAISIDRSNPPLPQDALFACLLTQQTGIDTSHPFN